LRQEDGEFKASLGYKEKPPSQKNDHVNIYLIIGFDFIRSMFLIV
jgi:hypothetical protein